MTITLRPYQEQAIDAVGRYLESFDDNPCVVLPTGSGKTPVIAWLCKTYCELWPGTRILILAHVKELLAQADDKLKALWPEGRDRVGVYSAGMRRRDTSHAVIIAGIQSVYNKADQLGAFDLVFIDEAHLVPADGEGMYRTLLKDLRVMNPRVRVVGFTATPYRLDCGLICAPDHLLNAVCYDANVKDLIGQGFLSKLRGKAGYEADIGDVHTRGGDFIASELDDSLADDEKVRQACADIAKHCADRKAWVVFCAGVKHAEMVCAELGSAHAITCSVITGETPTPLRDARIAAFKSGELRCLVNINVLSIGFDAPHIDAVIMLRPTQSPGLYYQQVGRGLRLSPGKQDCLVLDLAGNVRRHGPIDQVDPAKKGKEGDEKGEAPTKTCPECAEIIFAGLAACSACGYEFPRAIAKHATKAEAVSPVSETIEQTWPITDVAYRPHAKKDAPEGHPRTLRVEYLCGFRSVSEWVCVEHSGFARNKAERWWAERVPGAVMPDDAEQAALIGNAGGVKEPSAVVVKLGGKYPEIARFIFASPCGGCKHFDRGHCHKWDDAVPDDAQANGCEHFAALALTATDDDADCPF